MAFQTTCIKFTYFILSCLVIQWIPLDALATTMAERTSGKILIQVERHGEAWYVNPNDGLRYYLGRPHDAFEIMRFLGVGITDENLKAIPMVDEPWDANVDLLNRVRGKIMLQVESHGEAWYVSPLTSKRYYLGRPTDAFRIMQNQGIGIRTRDLLDIQPNIHIATVEPKGSGSSEYVEVRNAGKFSQSTKGWFITNGNGHYIHFPKGTVVEPGETIRLTNTKDNNIWNDDSGKIKLYGKRRVLVDVYNYTLPSKVLLNVPFSSQAPLNNWGSPFNEACEETILVMLTHYFNTTPLTPESTNTEILNMVNWEMSTYGYHEDTSANDTARTAREYAGLSATVSYNVTLDHIKQLLNQDKLIMAPVNGKALYNPHYKNGGPYYHMILIIGYDGDQLITHDPGTHYGAEYRYNSNTFVNAIHDLTQPESNIANGKPAMIIIEK